ncbi:hypothetical protein J4455_04935 [Candidatus Woesearchaeota archaeon]|nr:hypothetical protein [Candidatus Woesearchaeota archaeon]
MIYSSSIVYSLTWQETTSLLPSNRVMHSSLAYRSPVTGKTFLYVINGDSNTGSGGDSLIYISEIQPNGNILSWNVGNNFGLADTADQASLIYEDGNDAYIYVIAGSGCTNQIQYAKIVDHISGELSDWSFGYYNLDNTIGDGCNQNDVRDLAAVLDGNVVYLIGGRIPGNYVSSVRWNQINSTGGFSNQWTTATPITLDGINNIELARHTAEIIEINSVKYVYLFGGENNNGVRNTVYRKKLSDMRSSCNNVGDPGCWVQGNNLPATIKNHASFSSILSYGVSCIGKYGYISYGNKIYGACFDNVNPTWSDVTLNNALPNGVSRYKHSSASLNEIKYIIGGAVSDVANQDGTKNVYYTLPSITGIQININPSFIFVNGEAEVQVSACINNNPFPNCLTNGNAAPDGTIIYFSVDNTNIGNVNILSNLTKNGDTTVKFTGAQFGSTNVHAKTGNLDISAPVNVVNPSSCTLAEASIIHPTDDNYVYDKGALLHYGIMNLRFRVKAIGNCDTLHVHFLINEVNNMTGNSTGEVLLPPLLNNVPGDVNLSAGNEQFVSSTWTTEYHAPNDINETIEDGNYDLEYMFVGEINEITGSGINSSNWIQVDNINGGICWNEDIDINEECDCGPNGCLDNNIPGHDLDNKSCGNLGYLSGTLDCIKYGYPNQCMFNISGCAGRCGNNILEPSIGEICDPPNSYCASPPYFKCSNDCTACLSIQPGLQTILTKTECQDDGNGDNVGTYQETTTIVDTDPPIDPPVSTTVAKECTLVREVYIPFFSNLNIVILVILLGGFYLFKKKSD